MSEEIIIKHALKKYGDNVIIPDLSLDIREGEFFTLLGPSGCGKTTLLRMIAGFNSIEGGDFFFGEKRINDLDPAKRNIGMVFQNHAIFPHYTVRKNVEFGLKNKKFPKDKIKTQSEKFMKLMQIDQYADRMPERLSGGQQQRVALARALCIEPDVLLMDEPLSNLDAKLRVEMRSAIREVQKQVGITTVYVTHDQEEALSISDRIAVMKKGVIQQTASPHTIYTRPYNVFVSTFIGHSNLFHATVRADGSGKAVVFNDGYVMPMDNLSDEVTDGMQVIVSVRPEEFSIQPQGQGLQCRIKNKVFLGKYNTYFLDFEEKMLVPNQPSIEFSQDLGHAERLLDVNETVTLKPNAAKVNVFTADGERNLLKGVVLHE